MSSSAIVLEDSSKLSFFDRLLFKLESLLNLLGGIVIFLLVFLATANVLGRWIFNLPISGYIDWVEQSMAFMAFLGIAYTQRLGGHIRMDMLIGRLHGIRLWIVECISALIMLFITLILVYGSYLHFMRAYSIGDSSLDIDLPIWPAKLVVTIALSILALRLLLQIWGYIKAIFEHKAIANKEQPGPIAVPLIEDAATIAAHEAESVIGAKNE
ncbi:MAG: TRAP transporter small permease [Pseudomonadota bacterium]